jgi:hypothetical protein
MFLTLESAEKCHPDKHCETCGKEMKYNDFWTKCEQCRIALKYAEAKHVKADDYNEPVFANDRYYHDIDELLEYYDGEWDKPDVVYGSVKRYIKIDDAESIVFAAEESVMFDDEPEVFSKDAVAELKNFIDSWNLRHMYEYFEQDDKLIVDMGWHKEKQPKQKGYQR